MVMRTILLVRVSVRIDIAVPEDMTTGHVSAEKDFLVDILRSASRVATPSTETEWMPKYP